MKNAISRLYLLKHFPRPLFEVLAISAISNNNIVFLKLSAVIWEKHR